MKVKIYVEGGGDQARLKRKCRRGFSRFFSNAGLERKPKIVACGSRQSTYEDIRTAVKAATPDVLPLLLVDSEGPVQEQHQRDGNFDPWGHLRFRDGWVRPQNVDDDQAHLMVQCMESWFLADRQCLQNFFRDNFQANALPGNPNIEEIDKQRLFDSLKKATRHTQKGRYDKGAHSFEILGQINPARVFQHSPWAKRLKNKLEGYLKKE